MAKKTNILNLNREYNEMFDGGQGGGGTWGSITGTLSNQTDLQNALNAKANDNTVVKLSGNQDVGGVKNFTQQIQTTRTGEPIQIKTTGAATFIGIYKVSGSTATRIGVIGKGSTSSDGLDLRAEGGDLNLFAKTNSRISMSPTTITGDVILPRTIKIGHGGNAITISSETSSTKSVNVNNTLNWTFTNPVVVPDATLRTQAVNKGYVDDKIFISTTIENINVGQNRTFNIVGGELISLQVSRQNTGNGQYVLYSHQSLGFTVTVNAQQSQYTIYNHSTPTNMINNFRIVLAVKRT